MAGAGRAARTDDNPRTFDVVCAGSALWDVDAAPSLTSGSPTFRPGRGAVHAALAVVRQGLRVGLATVFADDTVGRLLRERLARADIATDGVVLSRPSSGLFFVEGGSRQALAFREEEDPVTIPSNWSARVLLMSGMSPVVAHGAALCRAARAARRAGSVVMVDVNARWHLWKGRDARSIRMILREADVVWCSAEDLLGLNMDVPSIRSAMRPEAVFAMSDGLGKTWATGPFGEVVTTADNAGSFRCTNEAFAAAICVELARAGHASPASGELWSRALRQGQLVAGQNRAK